MSCSSFSVEMYIRSINIVYIQLMMSSLPGGCKSTRSADLDFTFDYIYIAAF